MTTKAAARNEADGYLASHRITFVPQSKDMKTGDGTRAGYTTISARGLDWDSVPMRLFQKAKRLGTWDPQAIDLGRDASDWSMMTPVEKDFILRTVALFQAGEEGVTKDLLPLIMAVAQEGRLEEEIFLTSFLWEEAKHVELFRRWLDDVAAAREDLSRFLTPSYSHLFMVELPAALGRLKDDPSASAQIRAAVTYNMVIEGVLAETGYHGFRQSLETAGKLPGLLAGIRLIARDESRHIRYGVFLLNRLINSTPGGWEVMNLRMNELLGPALSVVTEFWDGIAARASPRSSAPCWPTSRGRRRRSGLAPRVARVQVRGGAGRRRHPLWKLGGA